MARFHFASKGHDLLLRVLSAPKWRARPLRVSLWGGDHGNLKQVLRLIELYGLDAQVRYEGTHNDIESLWAEHHGLLLPSRVEGNALALIEAMLCGAAIVATDVGGVAEALGPAGVLVDPRDPEALAGALTALIASPAERRRLGEAARARALEYFTEERFVHEYRETYRALADRHHKSGVIRHFPTGHTPSAARRGRDSFSSR